MSCYSIHDGDKPLPESTEFIVSPGPSHLHSPLGHSDVRAHSHYIRPTAHFTTEYEDAFRDASHQENLSRTSQSSDGGQWSALEDALEQIIGCKFEVDVTRKALQQVKERKLAEDIESACMRFEEASECGELSQHLRQMLQNFVQAVKQFRN